MQRLLLMGLNHATAPLEVREKLAFSTTQRRCALRGLRERFPGAEAVILSTCNRVELYVSRPTHELPRPEQMVDFLGRFHQLHPDQFSPHLYHKANVEAVAHLFSVASSLDSMILGETQILGQVREAYDLARSEQSAGLVLHPLFQRALAVGKQVMTQTTIAEGQLSVASVAVDYARRIFDQFSDKTILSVGAGKMATLVLRHFAQLSPGRLLVCNRDHRKAEELARRFQGTPAAFEHLSQHLVAADVVVCATGSSEPIITAELFEPLRKLRRYRPIFMIDIAMPRDIDPRVGELEHVYLYNIDDLQQVVRQNQSQRNGSLEAARRIVEMEVNSFGQWHRAREMGPMIEQLYARHHRMAQDELRRTLNKMPELTDDQVAHFEDLARRVVNKLLHDPVQRLRNGQMPHGMQQTYVHALEKLFNLDPPTTPKQDDDAEGPSAT
ncbi:MAG: glutamyl-tRNA reductase [Phycisphaerales bacterium]|nr:glutamyl-tRNA reductase [Phycisphaerales bacterium]